MKKIFKYNLPIRGRVRHQLGYGTRVLSVGIKPDGKPHVWVEEIVGASALVGYTFHVAFTGDDVPRGRFIGTMIHPDGFVAHAYVEEPS